MVIFTRWTSGGTMSANHPACLVAMVSWIQRCTLIFAAVYVCVLLAERWLYLQTASFSHVLDVGSLRLGCVVVPDRWGLLANRLQSIKGAFDVTDLCGKAVYGLHGTIQLLAASHQCVHALWETQCEADMTRMKTEWVELPWWTICKKKSWIALMTSKTNFFSVCSCSSSTEPNSLVSSGGR